MKRLLIASVAAACFSAAPAYAQSSMFSWSGFYIGGNAGYAWGNPNATEVQGASAGAYNGIGDHWGGHFSAFTGGGQLGINWQVGKSVVGLEGDIGYLGNSNTAGPSPLSPGDTFLKSDSGWYSTIRGRLGTTALFSPQTLLYATGGVAFVNANSFVFDNTGGTTITTAGTGTRTGWAAGGGIEWAYVANWTARIEYLHIGLGSDKVAGVSSAGTSRAWAIISDENIVRFGINYKFGN